MGMRKKKTRKWWFNSYSTLSTGKCFIHCWFFFSIFFCMTVKGRQLFPLFRIPIFLCSRNKTYITTCNVTSSLLNWWTFVLFSFVNYFLVKMIYLCCHGDSYDFLFCIVYCLFSKLCCYFFVYIFVVVLHCKSSIQNKLIEEYKVMFLQ